MHAPRRSTSATWFALCWFVLVLAVGGATPMLRQQTLELLCSTSGPSRFIVIGSDAEAVPAGLGGHTLDCPLCLAAMLPLSDEPRAEATPLPRFHFSAVIYASWIAALHAAPLPARGPPGAA